MGLFHSLLRMQTGMENVSDHGTIGPRKFLGLPENILTFRSKKKRVYWPDINVNFSLAENILNLKKTDALINWNLPHTLEKSGDIRRMIQDFVTNLPLGGGITTV